MQQRWVKLPNGNVIDANRILFISRPESYPKMDEEGNDGIEWAVMLGTSLTRDSHIPISGTKDEIGALIGKLVGATG